MTNIWKCADYPSYLNETVAGTRLGPGQPLYQTLWDKLMLFDVHKK